ncbi:MAG: hypothetical protein ACYC9M_15565 [Desulfobulbaceae bacterium]
MSKKDTDIEKYRKGYEWGKEDKKYEDEHPIETFPLNPIGFIRSVFAEPLDEDENKGYHDAKRGDDFDPGGCKDKK